MWQLLSLVGDTSIVGRRFSQDLSSSNDYDAVWEASDHSRAELR